MMMIHWTEKKWTDIDKLNKTYLNFINEGEQIWHIDEPVGKKREVSHE